MENSEQSLEEQLTTARAKAAIELAEIRRIDERELTAQTLVRKAILLQFEDSPDGYPQEIEEALQSALRLDERYIDAYVELGRYYYAILDDSQTAKAYFLKALSLLKDFGEQTIQGLLDCDGETNPELDRRALQSRYEEILLGKSST